MVDRKPGESRNKERDSHNPIDILTKDAIPASFGIDQAAGAMETDKTKWLVCGATAGWLLYEQADIFSACFAAGGILATTLGKVRITPRSLLSPAQMPLTDRLMHSVQVLRRVMTQPVAGSKNETIGMPSLHALSLFYIASYFSAGWLRQCAIVLQQISDKEAGTTHGGASHASPLHAIGAVAEVMGLAVASATLILVSGAMAYHRTQVGQHSTKEVTYGIGIGMFMGAGWKLTAGSILLCIGPLSKWLIEEGWYTQTEAVRSWCR
jgi:hypothetical protein